jgi:1-acyl-sn-glycerol-3-phosphate acyltransferase
MSNISKKYPCPPPALQRKGSWILKWLGLTYLRLTGWQATGQFPTDPKCVLIVAPHTSNWDFVLGVAFMFAVDLRVSFLGKHTIFKPPFKKFLTGIGGIPVDRRESHGVVGQCVAAFQRESTLLLALAPEGTRKGPSKWKSGFYQIALGAGVPIFPVAFDAEHHCIRLMPLFQPTGKVDEDMKELKALFLDVKGFRARPSEAPERPTT